MLHALLIIHIANVFLNSDSRITGRRLAGGLFLLPGFGRGVSIPVSISVGCCPVSAAMFSSSAISLVIDGGAYLISSADISSMPALFPFFILLVASWISFSVNGVVSFLGW